MIYVNGDSWSQITPYATHDHIWPSLVANKLGMPLINQSIGCGNNTRILNNLENLYLENQRPDFIILGLTTHCREAMSAAEMSHWNISHGFAKSELTGEDDVFISKWWAANSFDPLESIFNYYKILNRLHELCCKFGCPYFMFQVWDTSLAQDDVLGNEEKIAIFLKKFYTNPTAYFYLRYSNALQTLSQLKRKWNYVERPISLDDTDLDDTKHPNCTGHQKIADFVLEHIKKVKHGTKTTST